MFSRIRAFLHFLAGGPFGRGQEHGNRNRQYTQLEFDWHTLEAAGVGEE